MNHDMRERIPGRYGEAKRVAAAPARAGESRVPSRFADPPYVPCGRFKMAPVRPGSAGTPG